MATNALRLEEPVPERAGAVRLRVAEPRWYLSVLVLRHGFVLPICRLYWPVLPPP